MIDDALIFLKNRLNTHIKSILSEDQALEDQVVFLEGQQADTITFKQGAVSLLLINLEQETSVRSPDPYVRYTEDGKPESIFPDIYINLYILFVARYKQYESALRYLSEIIQYFQYNRLFTVEATPELGERIGKLTMELNTLPLSEQNDIWSALRVSYLPSAYYKVRMLVYSNPTAEGLAQVKEREISISEKS